jgi:hypothetical protein
LSGRWAGGPTYRCRVVEGWRPRRSSSTSAHSSAKARRSSSTSARGLEEPGIRSWCGERGGRHRRWRDRDRGADWHKGRRSRARVRVGGAAVASGGVEACCGLVHGGTKGGGGAGEAHGRWGWDAEEERRRARAGEEEAGARRNKLKPIKISGLTRMMTERRATYGAGCRVKRRPLQNYSVA